MTKPAMPDTVYTIVSATPQNVAELADNIQRTLKVLKRPTEKFRIVTRKPALTREGLKPPPFDHPLYRGFRKHIELHKFTFQIPHSLPSYPIKFTYRVFEGRVEEGMMHTLEIELGLSSSWSFKEPIRRDARNYISPENGVAGVIALLKRLRVQTAAMKPLLLNPRRPDDMQNTLLQTNRADFLHRLHAVISTEPDDARYSRLAHRLDVPTNPYGLLSTWETHAPLYSDRLTLIGNIVAIGNLAPLAPMEFLRNQYIVKADRRGAIITQMGPRATSLEILRVLKHADHNSDLIENAQP